MKIKDLVTDMRAWLFLIGFVAIASTTALGWWKLPGRVDEVESQADENKDHVQKVAESVDKYVEIQKVKDSEREKRYQEQMTHQHKQNEMMWKVLERVTKEE